MTKRDVVAAKMTYEQLNAAVGVRINASPNPVPFALGLSEYLTAENLAQVSDEALAQVASYYTQDRGGHAIEVARIVAGEREQRAKAALSLSQRTATKTLLWSMVGTLAAIVAAVAAIVSVFK